MFSLLRENVRIAFDAIRSQLLRTILTVLIIAIGITALVAILSLVKALENTISSDFSSMGSNTFNLQRYEFQVQRRGSGEQQKVNPILSYRQVKEFEENYEYPFTQVSLSFTGTSDAEVKYESEKTDPEVNILGVNQNFLENSGLKLADGRNFNFFDIQNNNNVCVLGSDFKKGLFENIDPIGKTISIRGSKFKVIGILEEKGATFGNNQDLRVLIPIQIARSMYTQANINYNVSIKVDDKEMMDGAQDEAIITFRNIRGLAPVEANNFGIERSDDLINQIGQMTGYLSMAAWIISMITVLGSSIALMNIMLVSVTERTKEIGLRKALGAKRRDIIVQFLFEAMTLTTLGGLIGIILSILGSYTLAYAMPSLPSVIPLWAITSGLAVSVTVGLLFGVFPAFKAASLDPIESLRWE